MKMTDEYAAQHFHRMGWMWGRLEAIKYEKTWGPLKAKQIEKELREKIAQQIEQLRDGIEPKNEYIAKYAPVDATEIVWRAAQIARGLI
jgi:hypothetical protein